MRSRYLLAALLLLAGGQLPGCDDPDDDDSSVPSSTPGTTGDDDSPSPSSTPGAVDADADGVTDSAGDCDDSDGVVYPGAIELCDGKDNDCDEAIDEAVQTDFHPDADHDGYGDNELTVQACTAPDGYVIDSMDCDDTSPSVHPGAPEVPGDGIDQDCNGTDGPTADLNGDAWPDLVVANYQSGSGSFVVDSYIYWGSSQGLNAGSRTALPTLGASAVCVADLDLDGFQDVVFANHRNNDSYAVNSYVYRGLEEGPVSSERIELPTLGATDCGIGDFNGDGWPDIAFSGYRTSSGYAGTSYVYYGSSSGFSSSARFEAGSYGNYSVTVGDANDDGYDDLLQLNSFTGSSRSTESYLYLGASSGLAAERRTALPTLCPFEPAAIVDVDQDGFKDIVIPQERSDSSYDVDSYIYYGSVDGYSIDRRTSLPVSGARGVAVADLDGDGFLDVVFASFRSGDDFTTTSYVYWGSDAAYAAENRTGVDTVGALGVAITDVDQDGYSDLVFANYRDGDTYQLDSMVYRGGPGGFSSAARDMLPTNGARAIQVSDLERDGYPDIVFGGHYDGSSYATNGYVYPGSNDGVRADARLALPMVGALKLRVADP